MEMNEEHLQIPFGTSHFSISIPAGSVATIALPKEKRADSKHPDVLGDHRLRRFSDASTLCIVNDGTRPTRTRSVIEQGGLNCHYMVATGAHAPPTKQELVHIFGPEFNRKRIWFHDAKRSSCRFIGKTQRKTPVRFNNAIFSYKRILIVGSVEPHYFAGYTGGRKGLLPGVAAYDTIEKNHALFFSPGAEPLKLDGNPVHEDLMDAAALLEIPTLSLNMVLDGDNEILGAFLGDLEGSFTEAVKLARSHFVVEVAKRADLVIACAPFPMDSDLYQSHKALLHAARACKSGGEIILISQCRNGIGPPAFYDLMSEHRSLDSLWGFARDNYQLGYHKAASFAKILMHHRVSIISSLASEDLRPVHMQAVQPTDIERTVSSIAAEGGTTYYMPQASLTVPVVATESDIESSEAEHCGRGKATVH